MRVALASIAVALLLGCGPGLEEGLPSPDARQDRDAALDHAAPDSAPALDHALADSGLTPDRALGPDQWACREFFDNNYGHVSKGRATICGGNACAFGSGDNLGLYSLAQSSWVREVKKGYFEAGRCP